MASVGTASKIAVVRGPVTSVAGSVDLRSPDWWGILPNQPAEDFPSATNGSAMYSGTNVIPFGDGYLDPAVGNDGEQNLIYINTTLPIVVTNRADSGDGTLRQAMLDALDGDTITFDPEIFPLTSPMTITLFTALPNITQGNLTIDASNTGMVLDGRYVDSGDGFHITSDGNVIKGLQIIRFPDDGVEITNGAKNNTIGGDWTVGNGPHGEGNIITLNGGDGVDINGAGTMSNTVSGNLIGLDLDGTRDIRVQAMAISPNYVSDQTLFIGTKFHGVWKTTDGGSSWTDVNSGLSILDVRSLAISPNYATDKTLFAGTADGGIFRTLDGGGSWTRVDGGGISSDVVALAISPDYANDGHIFAAAQYSGVFASTDWGDTWTGRSNGLTDTGLYNIAISPNYGVDATLFTTAWSSIYKSTNQGYTWTVASTILGTFTLAFSPDYANDETLFAGGGLMLRSTDRGSNWMQVGDDPGWADIRTLAISPDYVTDKTLFAGDFWGGGVFRSKDRGQSWQQVLPGCYNDGLSLSPNYAQDETVFVGRGTAGGIWKSVNGGDDWMEVTHELMEHGNHNHGVHVTGGAQGNTIGGNSPGERNVISHNDIAGVDIHDTGTAKNIVTGNYIGTDVSGTTALGNGWQGVALWSETQENVIGGTTDSERNVISGNGERGVAIDNSGTMYNTVSGNYIGTDASGTIALGNYYTAVGIRDGAKYNQVGGPEPEDRNVISGNEFIGVHVTGSGTVSNTVVGNYIGTDFTGMAALGNARSGVDICAGAQYNQVGGTAEERNIISTNGWAGVLLSDSDTMSNTIIGNYIGTDSSGMTALGNAQGGVDCWNNAQRNTIKHNVISGNSQNGVRFDSCDSNTIVGNYIGTNTSYTVTMGNEWSGVSFCCGAQENIIGDGNVIAHNNGNGIEVVGSTCLYNTITQNSVHSNVLKGIENWGGGNTELPPPTLTDANLNSVSGNVLVSNAIIEIFSDDEAEGRVYEGSTTANTTGNFTFTQATSFNGPYLTATATDAEGNTSEFSNPVSVPTPTCTVTSTADSGVGSLRWCLSQAEPSMKIRFDTTVFPPASPATITLTSELPHIITDSLTIDGSNAGVVLDGSQLTGCADGLHVDGADYVTIRGLQIISFCDDGVEITNGAKNNLIGGDWTVGSAPHGEGNVITLNGDDGVDINGTGTMSNTVSGNLIGLDLDGTRDIRVQAMTISPDYAHDQTLFIGTKFHGVWKTTDGGGSWVAVSSGLTISNVHSLAISPNYATDGTLFAGTADGGIFKTTNRGDSWTRVDGGVISSDVVALAISPDHANDGHIFAATGGEGVFASTDWGSTWADRSSGLTDTGLYDIAISPNYGADGTLFAAAWSGIFKSEKQDDTWTVASTITGTFTLAFSPDYVNDRTLFAGGDLMFRSTDQGSSWKPVGGDPGWVDIRTLAISPDYETDQTLFAGDFWGGGVFRSMDGGESWDSVLSGRYNHGLSLSPNYAQDETVFVGRGTASGIWKSVDGGSEWSEVTNELMEHGNHRNGVWVRDGAKGNIIGGNEPGKRNVISHNDVAGVSIYDTGTANNIVIGNYIGTDVSGTTALGNGWEGVHLPGGAEENVIGGTATNERNVISGNGTSGVQLSNSSTMFNTVNGNYIGTDASGTTALGNGTTGVAIQYGAKYNRVERNVVSGNENTGMDISGSGIMSNTIVANYIGVDAGGTVALGNDWSGVILWGGAQQNVIGDGNVIAYNKGNGVEVGGSTTLSNTITQNSIHSNALRGIENWDGGNMELSPPTLTDANINSVGGTVPVPYAIVEIFSDDADEGRVYEGSTTADDAGNFTFSKATGFSGPYLTATATDAEGNTSEFSDPIPLEKPTCTVTSTADSGLGTLRGCLSQAEPFTMIGFDTTVFPPASPMTISVASELPYITTNGLTIDASSAGVVLDGSQLTGYADGLHIDGADYVTVRGLQIVSFPDDSIELAYGTSHAVIGGSRDIGNGPLGQGNLFSGSAAGIYIQGEPTINNTVCGNFVGTDLSGSSAFSNTVGIQIAYGASGNTIGGATPGENNLVSGNGQCGVELAEDATHNRVAGNFIGTDVHGTSVVSNGWSGVCVWSASFNKIGGDQLGERNLISGNESAGVGIYASGTSNNTIMGNYIGTNASGTAALPNTNGIEIWGGPTDNIIGGDTANAGNLISGNSVFGINMGGSGTANNTISNNYIGTDKEGKTAIPNIIDGIRFQEGATNNVIIGNLISGNGEEGIQMSGDGISGNQVASNTIGANATRSGPLPNLGIGVLIGYGAERSIIGPENTIAFNQSGICIDGTSTLSHTITQNSIYSNTNKGILLTNGGNGGIPSPTITTAAWSLAVGTAPPDAEVEVFSDDNDEGRVYEGSTTADGEGNFTLTQTTCFSGPYLTATATDAEGNTSEFSQPVAVSGCIYLPLILKNYPPLPDLASSTKSVDPTIANGGDALTYTIVLRNTGYITAFVRLTDTIPAHTTYVPASVSGGTFDPSDNAIGWAGPIQAGGSSSIQFQVKVNDPFAGNLTNTVNIDDSVHPVLDKTASTSVVVCNPSFETGDFTCWTHGGELDQSIENGSALLGNPDYGCRGGVPLGSAWLKQTISIPSTGSPKLSFLYQVYTQDRRSSTGLDPETYDSFDVYINDTLILRDGNTTDNFGCDKPINDLGRKHFVLDLSQYKGQDVTVSFYNVSRYDNWYNTWTKVDDIRVE